MARTAIINAHGDELTQAVSDYNGTFAHRLCCDPLEFRDSSFSSKMACGLWRAAGTKCPTRSSLGFGLLTPDSCLLTPALRDAPKSKIPNPKSKIVPLLASFHSAFAFSFTKPFWRVIITSSLE
jgi:hypothetical protein